MEEHTIFTLQKLLDAVQEGGRERLDVGGPRVGRGQARQQIEVFGKAATLGEQRFEDGLVEESILLEGGAGLGRERSDGDPQIEDCGRAVAVGSPRSLDQRAMDPRHLGEPGNRAGGLHDAPKLPRPSALAYDGRHARRIAAVSCWQAP
ncbi:MAG: hypothetical protein OES32_10070 [Acidobacteriota bacterium]|nr:hypothetical protein [Acidobacteriota bacterium]